MSLIDDFESIPKMTHEKIGRVLKSEIDPVVEYTDHLADTIKGDLSGLRVAVDCATVPPPQRWSASCVWSSARRKSVSEPDGININDNCGSTHLGQLKERVRSGNFDLGVALTVMRIAA
ncbi:MAG: hypothetical protein ACLSGI_03680 [Butyricicoccaceae bacterium]